MATTLAGRQLTEAHRLAQARLSAETIAAMLDIWPLLDYGDIDATAPRWIRTAARVVQSKRAKSVQLGAGYMRAFRAVELGLTDGFQAATVAALDPTALATSLTVTGPVRLKQSTALAVPEQRAMEHARTSSARAAARHALDGGRSTITYSIEGDSRALGWARATSGNPCAFCAIVASRGPIYRSEDSAGFQPHDGCHCEPEPVYSRTADWPPGSRRFAEIYDEHAKGETDPLNAFRRALAAN